MSPGDAPYYHAALLFYPDEFGGNERELLLVEDIKNFAKEHGYKHMEDAAHQYVLVNVLWFIFPAISRYIRENSDLFRD